MGYTYLVGDGHTRNSSVNSDTYFKTACSLYQKSGVDFSSLKINTQKDYVNNLRKACDTKVDGNLQLGNIRLKNIRHRHLSIAYENWQEKGIRSANYIATCVSIVLNYAIRPEAILHNQMSLVKKSKPKQRKVMWKNEEIKLFLDTAYSDFKWRSIGLIFHMAYEWAQRVGDMRTLTWDAIDFQNKRLDYEQSKRGSEVHLPIRKGILKMLVKQKETFDFYYDDGSRQEYVAPRVKPKNNFYSHYTLNEIHKLINEVKEEANLPQELQVRDLRRTAIVEMVEEGVDLVNIMQVSGHQSVQSVRPYLVNTYSGASNALERRFKNDDEY